MAQLEQVDRELAELSPRGPDVPALLTRLLGEDRSLARLEELLASLGGAQAHSSQRPAAVSVAPRIGSARPPARTPSVAPSKLPARKSVPAAAASEHPASAPPAAEPSALESARGSSSDPAAGPGRSAEVPELAAVDAEGSIPAPVIRGSRPPQAAELGAADVGGVSGPASAGRSGSAPGRAASRATLVGGPHLPSPEVGFDEAELDAETAALLGDGPDTALSAISGPPASAALGVAQADVPTRVVAAPADLLASRDDAAGAVETHGVGRESMRDLLNREIDPGEFPTHPSEPAPDAQDAAADDDGFEMIVDDDEVMEIDDGELEEIE